LEDTTIEDVLKTVESLYANKDFDGALKILKENQNTLPQGVWNYNMGTIYGKTGELALARYHFLQAEASGFSEAELLKNKALVENSLTTSRYEEAVSVNDYLIKNALFASEGLLTTLAFICLLFSLGILSKTKKVKSALLLLIPVLVFACLNLWINSWPKKIVIETQTIKEGPSAIFNNQGELPLGVMLITTKKDGWLYIQYPSRFNGWIKDTGLKELK